MKSIEWYKEKFKTDSMDLVVHSDGRVEVPLWLDQYILRSRGLKSKKKRIIKKVLSRELTEIIVRGFKEEKLINRQLKNSWLAQRDGSIGESVAGAHI